LRRPGLIPLDLEQLKLELIEQRPPLRRLSELLMLQLGDPVLQLLDRRRLDAKLDGTGLPLGQQGGGGLRNAGWSFD